MAALCGLDAVAKVIASAAAPAENAHATEGLKWPEPLPLVTDAAVEPYPADALPGSLGAAVREVTAFVQCPIALAASSALSALSVVGQALVDVKRGPHLEGPVSLFLLSVADSGERKSECDRRFASVLREWEAEQAERIKPELAKSRADLEAWEAEREAILLNIKQARKSGEPTGEIRAALEQWETQKPEPVRDPHLLLESETAESLAWNLARPDGWPSGGILSSEAGIVFGGHSMRRDNIMQNLALLNKLWSGEPHRVGRRTSEQFTLSGARLTMGLAVQPEAVQTFFDESRGLARGSGFAARFLIAWPESTQGSRLYRDAPKYWPGLTAYQQRLRNLLSESLSFDQHGELAPCPLDMDAQAFAAWRAFHDGAEQELRSGGELAEVRDVASKAPENVARIAALFHLFDHGPKGSIGATYVAAAVRLVTWYLFEARRFLGCMVLPEAVSNAVKLEKWLFEAYRQSGANGVVKRDVMRTGPNSVRRKANLDAALIELRVLHRAKVDDDGRTIRLNPALLEAHHGAS
jgi:putative DNA primase/helicase